MIDTHAHIDDPQYADDLPGFIRAQQQGGVTHIIVPGVNAASIDTVDAVCRQFPGYLFPAAGLHPEDVREDWQQQLERIHHALLHPAVTPYIAIGEIGLDYHFDTTYKEQQQDAFRQQLQWAMQFDLPVLIHSRDATEDTLTILREFPGLQGVMHCFSGSNETAKQIVRMGFYLGIGGVITFKNCRLRDNLSDIPLDRILLETDAPYMAPVPHRGQRNESCWMTYVVDVLADVFAPASPADIIAATTANARRLFRL